MITHPVFQFRDLFGCLIQNNVLLSIQTEFKVKTQLRDGVSAVKSAQLELFKNQTNHVVFTANMKELQGSNKAKLIGNFRAQITL
jgi:hypothetical protein